MSKLGYRFAMWEHKTRYLGLKFLIAAVVLGIWNLVHPDYAMYLASLIALGIAFVLEGLSLIAHLLEKRAMKSIRHPRR